MADWREADHPRDPHTGEFTDKPGGWLATLARQLPGSSRYKRVAGHDITQDVAENAREFVKEGFNRHWDEGDIAIQSMAKRQGWDAKPAVGSSDELDEAIAEGGTEVFRGVKTARVDLHPQDMLRMLQEGELYFGNGIYSNGIYMSSSVETADVFGQPIEGWPGSRGGIMRMVISPDARIWDWKKRDNHAEITYDAADDLRQRRADLEDQDEPDYNSGHVADGLLGGEITQDVTDTLEGNLGAVLAMQGYDVIRILRTETRDDGGVGADQYIVLNPTILLVQQDLHADYEPYPTWRDSL